MRKELSTGDTDKLTVRNLMAKIKATMSNENLRTFFQIIISFNLILLSDEGFSGKFFDFKATTIISRTRNWIIKGRDKIKVSLGLKVKIKKIPSRSIAIEARRRARDTDRG